MGLTKVKKGQIADGVITDHKTISKTGSYTITAEDVDEVGHLFVLVDSTGADNPLEITLPTPAEMSGMWITVWLETFNKQTKVLKNPTGVFAAFWAVDDYITVTSDGTKYLIYIVDATAGGGPAD